MVLLHILGHLLVELQIVLHAVHLYLMGSASTCQSTMVPIRFMVGACFTHTVIHFIRAAHHVDLMIWLDSYTLLYPPWFMDWDLRYMAFEFHVQGAILDLTKLSGQQGRCWTEMVPQCSLLTIAMMVNKVPAH